LTKIVLYKTIFLLTYKEQGKMMTINSDNFLYAISKIRQNLFSFLEREMAEKKISDISPSDGDILFAIDRNGPLSLQELAALTMKDKSTVSSVVKKLEKKGYLTKEKGAEDGRLLKISLTPRALKRKAVLWKISFSMNERIFTGLTDEEKTKLFEIMEKIYKNLKPGESYD